MICEKIVDDVDECHQKEKLDEFEQYQTERADITG